MEEIGEAQTEMRIIVIQTWYGLSIALYPVTGQDGRYRRGVINLRARKECNELYMAAAAGAVCFKS